MTNRTTEQRGGLDQQGFRFVYQDGRYSWTHPNEIKPGAVDCTDMDDAKFEMFYEENRSNVHT